MFNVNNNCPTGSSALMLGAQAIAGGLAECVIVVGFEQMEAGMLSAKWTDRANPADKFANVMRHEVSPCVRSPSLQRNTGRPAGCCGPDEPVPG